VFAFNEKAGSKSLLLGISLAIRLLLFTQASLAADAECSSDSGIPSGVIATIDVGHLRKSLAERLRAASIFISFWPFRGVDC